MQVAASFQTRRVVLFDGVCNLCNGAVQFIIRRDPHARFQFAALQSESAAKLLRAGPTLDSIVLVEGDRVFTRSAAALRIARGLRFPWPLLSIFWLVPGPLRDLIYDWVASHRYAWFGKRDSCMLPSPELRQRFMD
jgi:predicted DCC family thiol-disulfide oxidoreductase YuxK